MIHFNSVQWSIFEIICIRQTKQRANQIAVKEKKNLCFLWKHFLLYL